MLIWWRGWSGLLAERWNAVDVAVLASGVDASDRKLPSQAWMALRRLGWATTAPEGVTVNDWIVRMVQEQAGRALAGEHLEVNRQKFDDLSITWNSVDVTRPPVWPTSDDFRLGLAR
ncbi:hypothetical protein [Micromonospora sp. CB01531]|uniref:hypothetical protein n=1 Tax=Micromonospora sp. CB01531 TaxID=1718947 RepID=UPI00093EB490|nr:hypothetical protein [Micromonospora sp. CB01531]OKI53779.1 hypothetical protein A6A27_32195 [Micromonospora sp. CB01531]